MVELLPCPFCGGEPHLDRHDIFCDCGAMMKIPAYVLVAESADGYPTYEEAKQEMIDLWNTRKS
jgi:hypothetical protein